MRSPWSVQQADGRKLGDLALVLIEVVAEEVRLPVDGQARPDLGSPARRVRLGIWNLSFDRPSTTATRLFSSRICSK